MSGLDRSIQKLRLRFHIPGARLGGSGCGWTSYIGPFLAAKRRVFVALTNRTDHRDRARLYYLPAAAARRGNGALNGRAPFRAAGLERRSTLCPTKGSGANRLFHARTEFHRPV